MDKVTLIAARRYDGLEGSVKRGQEITVDEDRAAELIRRGLAALPGEEALPVQGSGEEVLRLVSTEDQAKLEAAQLKAAQDARLVTYARGGGWYHFVDGDDVMKVQGREDAIAELDRREAASAAGDAPPQ